MEKRMTSLDALRGVLILMIVYGHAAAKGDVLKHYVYSYHVAAFFFLSGYLFSCGKAGFGAFVKKKFLSLMAPYYIFSLISILVFTLLGSFASDRLDVAIKHTEVYKNILGMLYANAVEGYMKWNLPMWFLPCMFLTQIIFYPLYGLLSRLLSKKRLLILPAVFCTLILPYLDYFVFRVRALPFHLESAVFLMPFFALGSSFRIIRSDFSVKSPQKCILSLFLLVSGAVIALFMNSRVNYFLSSYGKITVFYLSAFLSVIGIFILIHYLRFRFLVILGQNTLSVLVMHKFPVVFFQIVLAPLWAHTGIVHTITALLTSAVSCILCIVIGRLIEKFAPFALGKSRPRIENAK